MLHGERVTRVDGLREPRLHALEPRRVGVAQRVEQRPTGEPPRAQTVQDGPVEAGHLGELGIRMERIAVAGEAIGERLIRARLVRDRRVGIALGRYVARTGWAAVTTEAALAADEHRIARGEQGLARGGVDRRGLVDDDDG